jgi:hypothetical protein
MDVVDITRRVRALERLSDMSDIHVYRIPVSIKLSDVTWQSKQGSTPYTVRFVVASSQLRLSFSVALFFSFYRP